METRTTIAVDLDDVLFDRGRSTILVNGNAQGNGTLTMLAICEGKHCPVVVYVVDAAGASRRRLV